MLDNLHQLLLQCLTLFTQAIGLLDQPIVTNLASQSYNLLDQHRATIAMIAWPILFIGILQNTLYTIQLPAAWLALRRYSQKEDTESAWQLLISGVAMPISLLVPAYNEAATIVENVHALLSSRYPDLELIVINDGSKDQTLDKLIEAFSLKPVYRAHQLLVKHAPINALYGSPLYPKLTVVDKQNGGKADALNAGINISRNPLFSVIDADSLLEPEALLRCVRPFMEDPKRMVAVGGNIRILNGCQVSGGQIKRVGLPRKILPLLQTVEYLRAFLMYRLAWSHWDMVTLISGAFGVFRRSIAVEVGGFSHNTVGEDYDLIIKMHRLLIEQKRPYNMRFVPEPVCWTEAPESFKVLGIQRKRWQRGALEVFFKHRTVMFNRNYGKMGLLAFPYSFLIDVLGPLAESCGYCLIPIYWLLDGIYAEFALAYIALFFVYGVFLSVAALILEEMELKRLPRARDLLLLGIAAIIENFGYRQINNVWRIVGWWQFIRKQKTWGEMTRTGVTLASDTSTQETTNNQLP